ncbi:unnamed protein product [Phytophthora fragariaefolia]|uniref:Unnamed protein product n=1 Tax=Phytophthora fragariaefolia TaxID=1490495 RepID=A0A9W7CX99_9STRA|nr:unnamed protein product [Phytophthora fragariaefolia]
MDADDEPAMTFADRATNLPSYLAAADADPPFGAAAMMRTWPADGPQTRRALQRPPGLAGPPGLGEPGAMDGRQSRVRLGTAGADLRHQHAATQFGPFRAPTPSPMPAASASFSSGDDQFGPSLLSSLRLSTGVFGDSSLRDQHDARGVSNPDLAELNTHSMKVGEMDDSRIRRAVDSPSTYWENREPTTSRRIDIQARSKTPRSPKKAREGRRKQDPRSDLRAKALEFSMEAINAFTPGSPMRPRRADRGRKMPSPASCNENSPSTVETSRNQSASRGKRRNQPADKIAASASPSATGSDNWKRERVNQSEELSSTRGPPPGLETDSSPAKLVSREVNKSRRKEDSKPSNRNTTSRRNSARGSDKGANTTRRQVYREKQVRESAKELPMLEGVAPTGVSSNTAFQSLQKSPTSSSSPKSELKTSKKLLSIPQDATANVVPTVMSSTVEAEAAKSPHRSTEIAAEVATSAVGSPTERDNDQGCSSLDHLKDANTNADASVQESFMTTHESLANEPATVANGGSSSSGDVHEETQDAVEEQIEPHQEKTVDVPESDDFFSPVDSSEDDAQRSEDLPTTLLKKSKRAPAMTAAIVDNSPITSQIETEPLTTKEPIPTPAVEKKHAAKEHRKEKSRKDKGEKKKSSRGKKDKRASSLAPKIADTSSGSASEAQDKIFDDLATRGTPLSARISQGLRKGGSAAAAAGLLAFYETRRGCVWVAGRLNIKGLLATSFSLVVYSYSPGSFPCDPDSSSYWVLLRIPLRLSVSGAVYISVGPALGTSMSMVRFPRPTFLHERPHCDGDHLSCHSSTGLPGGGHFPPQFPLGPEWYAWAAAFFP